MGSYITDIAIGILSVQTYFVKFDDMWGLETFPWKILTFRSPEIESDSHFSIQCIMLFIYPPSIYIVPSDCLKILRIEPSEI